MVPGTCQSTGTALRKVQIVCAEIDGHELDIVLDVGCGGLSRVSIGSTATTRITYMHMQPSEVFAKVELLLGPDILEVLVTEDHNATLCYKQGEIILLSIRQL
jgi:hypothetical protein